jgi:eukaryotic-like serine/threonine-protein kinase
MEDSDLLKDAGYGLEAHLQDDHWGGLYRARYLPHDREVLLRLFPAEIGRQAGAWELLLAEIEAWARLDHSGILQVLDWGKERDSCFLAMSVPEGIPLAALLLKEPDESGAERIFANLLASVEAARRWGVLHLGLGPSSIWVASDHAVRVGDFGFWYVARDFPSLKVPGGLFQAPEQAQGGHATAASDVYSLGIIYVALRFGLGAAGAAASGALLPAELGDLHPVIARCLERQPLARYRSAGELADALCLWPDAQPSLDYRDCPLCRLKAELQREAARREYGATYQGVRSARRSDWARYVWVAVIALAFITALVWWLALR